MASDLVVLATFNRRYEAEIARGFLDDAGIDSVSSADDAGGADVGLSFSRQVRLLVREEDAERARGVLESAGIVDLDS